MGHVLEQILRGNEESLLIDDRRAHQLRIFAGTVTVIEVQIPCLMFPLVNVLSEIF